MATITVNFTPASGIASYRVCYVPAGSTNPPTCINVTGSPVVIEEGITCGVRYDVAVASVCPPGAEHEHSSEVFAQTLALDCVEPPKTINVLGASGYMEPCIGGTINDYMGAVVYLDSAVTVNTIFNVIVRWSDLNTDCSFFYEQTLSVEILAGETTSNFNACNQGVFISSGANICGALVTGHDNGVDNIVIP
jgi:hypothetical protein